MNLGDVIDDALKAVHAFGNNHLMPHLIFCHNSVNPPTIALRLGELIFTRMKKYGIISLLLTILGMNRMNLVTKEKSKQAYQGKLKNEPGWQWYKGSVNDDLESFLARIHRQIFKSEKRVSFYLPKLSKEELKLVQQKNREYRETFLFSEFPYVDPEEMKKSKSKDMYMHGSCLRWTMTVNEWLVTELSPLLKSNHPDEKK